MLKKVMLLSVALALTAVPRVSTQAGTGPNGTDPRPFYNYGHNTNTLEAVEFALALGKANALEPDINVLPAGAIAPVNQPVPDGMVMYHDTVLTPNRVPLTVEEFLDGLHVLAKKYPHLALVAFDVKPAAATRENGVKLRDAVRSRLNKDGVNINIIYSVGTRDDKDFFTDIIGTLNEREAVQIDGEDRADEVVQILQGAAHGNIGYGDGTLGPGPSLPRAADLGSYLKAAWGFPKTVAYIYVISDISSMHHFIDAGVDGLIPDHFVIIPPLPGLGLTEFDGLSIEYNKALNLVMQQHPEVRYAKPEDNPFKPNVQAYGLEFNTMDTFDGGTNADLTFKLTGCRGTATLKYNAGMIDATYSTGRMESGNADWATIPSLNLGRLQKLEIYNDGTGLGGFPGWDLKDVSVSSARYLGPNFGHTIEYQATLNGTIGGDEWKTLNLTPNFQEPLPTIACPAPITVNNDPGKCNAVVTFAPEVEGMCPDVTAVSTPPSGSTFDVGTKMVSAWAESQSGPPSPACSFTVTVKDVETPKISCPAPITVDATGPLGAVVSFAPTAGDNCSAAVSSVPPSGSLFAIGTTNVTSTAQDPSSNQSSCSFTVHVKGAAEQIQDLITLVDSLGVKNGLDNALLVKLEAALAQLANQSGSPCGALTAFIDLVNAQKDKAISASDADALIAKAMQIRTVAGC